MTDKYFLDTCIWRDFYEDRLNRQGQPWGSNAAKLILKIIKNKAKILYSTAITEELCVDYSYEEIENMLYVLYLSGTLVRIEITEKEILEARELRYARKVPFVDCLIAVQAHNHFATLVSTDPHMFNELKDICSAVRPWELG